MKTILRSKKQTAHANRKNKKKCYVIVVLTKWIITHLLLTNVKQNQIIFVSLFSHFSEIFLEKRRNYLIKDSLIILIPSLLFFFTSIFFVLRNNLTHMLCNQPFFIWLNTNRGMLHNAKEITLWYDTFVDICFYRK